ncbi:MAG: hypothetical protein JXR70_00380 [Spirochaetales bacterium]|nr:hypothetical protein [Spirochaetales bacterium]
MRKAIIVIFTIFIILGFTGCDAMLEGFFPEFGDEATATLEIYADVSNLRANPANLTVPLYIIIEEQAPGTKILRLEFKVGDDNIQKTVTVPRRDYKVWAVADKITDGDIDAGDYSNYAYYYDTKADKTLDICRLSDPDVGDNIFVDITLTEDTNYVYYNRTDIPSSN